MSRSKREITYNKHQDLLNEINELFISIKLSRLQKGEIPSNEELDGLLHKIGTAFEEFDTPLRLR